MPAAVTPAPVAEVAQGADATTFSRHMRIRKTVSKGNAGHVHDEESGHIPPLQMKRYPRTDETHLGRSAKATILSTKRIRNSERAVAVAMRTVVMGKMPQPQLLSPPLVQQK